MEGFLKELQVEMSQIGTKTAAVIQVLNNTNVCRSALENGKQVFVKPQGSGSCMYAAHPLYLICQFISKFPRNAHKNCRKFETATLAYSSGPRELITIHPFGNPTPSSCMWNSLRGQLSGEWGTFTPIIKF